MHVYIYIYIYIFTYKHTYIYLFIYIYMYFPFLSTNENCSFSVMKGLDCSAVCLIIGLRFKLSFVSVCVYVKYPHH